MNYYIQGNKEKADQIKAAFEKLGYDTGNLGFTSSQLYYTIEGKVELMCYRSLQNLIKTHPDYKELKLPVEPKYKVGDKVIYNSRKRTITFIDEKYYYFDGGCAGCRIDKQDELLSPVPKPHYDIANFHAGMPVLVRADNNCRWDYSIFSRITGNEDWKFAVCNGVNVAQCIPFEGNEHLLGTTDMCDEMYINW